MNPFNRLTVVPFLCVAALLLAGCGHDITVPPPLPTPMPTPVPDPMPTPTPVPDQTPVPPAPGPTPDGRPTPTVVVDDKLLPSLRSIPAEDGAPRPVAVMTDKSNIPCEFVENELMIQSTDAQRIADTVARLRGTIVGMFDPAEFGLTGETIVLVRVVAPVADMNKLMDDLQAVAPGTGSQLRVNSAAGMDLLAVAAREAAGGMTIGLNFLSRNNNARDRNIREAASGNDLVSMDGRREKYDPNPHNWSYMKRGGNQNFGVAEAWSILDRAGRINNRVLIGIVDGGFDASSDYPALHTHFASDKGFAPLAPNDMTCTGGGGCPWHGTNVVDACMASFDNGRGAAGPAGPVARCVTVRITGDHWSSLGGMAAAFGQGARIINMSFSARVPAVATFTLKPSNMLTTRMRESGALLFAAAGNDNADIDAEDCFIACWEEAWHTPCENDGVIGVGSMELNSPYRRGDSNYGSEELDIWGAGYMWVGPDPANGNVHGFGATSGASPFVAGIAALIWAANPALSANDVEAILMDTCNRGRDGQCHRWPDATAAVIRALGNIPPELSNVKVERSGFVGRSLTFSCDAFDVEDGVPNVVWTSDRSGFVGSGTLVGRDDLPYGRHTFTCTATDRAGVSLVETRVFELVNAPPRLSIEQPLNASSYFAGQAAFFECYSYDIESAARLPDANLAWSSSRDGALGSGQFMEAVLRTVGRHSISLIGIDRDGSTARSSIEVTVNPPPPDGLPPTAFIYSLDFDPSNAKVDPATNEYYHEISMSGVGRDAEDGYLTGTNLTWVFESDSCRWAMPPGPVYGRTVNTQIYGYGRFRVTLTATDRTNKTGTHSRVGEFQLVR